MRPILPAGYRPPAPSVNPQIGRAIPMNEEGVPSGVRHSRETIILADHPFAHSDALEADGLLPLGWLTHYDGTRFYWTTYELHQNAEGGQDEPFAHKLYSCSFDHWENAPIEGVPIAYTGVANPDAHASALFIASVINVNWGMANGVPHFNSARVIERREWPFSRAIAEQVLYNGAMRWAVTIERGYPLGQGVNSPPVGGPLQSLDVPIWNIPTNGPDTETDALIGYTAHIFTRGEQSWNLLPARVGYKRAILPLGPSLPGSDLVIDPVEIGNVS